MEENKDEEVERIIEKEIKKMILEERKEEQVKIGRAHV